MNSIGDAMHTVRSVNTANKRPLRFGLLTRLFYRINPRNITRVDDQFSVVQCADGANRYLAIKATFDVVVYSRLKGRAADDFRDALVASIAWRDEIDPARPASRKTMTAKTDKSPVDPDDSADDRQKRRIRFGLLARLVGIKPVFEIYIDSQFSVFQCASRGRRYLVVKTTFGEINYARLEDDSAEVLRDVLNEGIEWRDEEHAAADAPNEV